MKLVAWVGGPEVEIGYYGWTILNISEDEAIALLGMNMWITLHDGLLVPVEVDE